MAITPASPRLRPRHIRLVMAPSDALRASSGNLAGNGRSKQLRFVDDHQHRVPEFAVGIEHAVEERRGTAHLLLDVEPFQIEHGRNAMLPDPRGDAGEFRLGALRHPRRRGRICRPG